MSFFQLFDFRSIDRPLSKEEKAEINTWSSRARVSSDRAIFTYSYGDFPRDEEAVVAKFFDAMYYADSGGGRSLIFRLPLAMMNRHLMNRYVVSEYQTQITVKDKYLLLKFIIEYDDNAGGWIDEDDDMLSDLLSLRQDLLNGDYSCLYLAWLRFAGEDMEYEEERYDEEEFGQPEDNTNGVEPPVPFNLKKLSPALKSFATFLGLDPFILQAAAVNSQDQDHNPKKQEDTKKLVAKLPDAVKNDYLLRLLAEEPLLSTKLRNEFSKENSPKEQSSPGRYTFYEISKIAAEIKSIHVQREAEKKEAARQEKLKQTKRSEDSIWQSVRANAALGTAKGYDKATELLAQLLELAKEELNLVKFKQQIEALKVEFKSVAFKRRLETIGL